MPTHQHRRGGDVGEQLGHELRRRARHPPPLPPPRRHLHALGLALLFALAIIGLIFLVAVAVTIIDPTGGPTL